MKIALLDVRQNAQNPYVSTMVSARNMVLIAEYLKADIVWDKNKIPLGVYDVIICGFGSNFSEYNKSSAFIKSNIKARIYWLVGEYKQSMFPPIHYGVIKENRALETIQNHERIDVCRWISKHNILNINLLIAKKPNDYIEKKYDCIYYSRWRPNRAKYLKEYLQGETYFSSDSKNFKQHKHIGCNPKWIKKLSWKAKKETLNLFRYSLYLEDEYTHKTYNHLANRWYESGFCNNVMFFDINCKNTIEHQRTEIRDCFDNFYYISSYNELQEKIKECNKDFKKHLNIQKQWRINELSLKDEMLQEFKKIVTGK